MAEGLPAVRKALRKLGLEKVEAREWRSSLVLNGQLEHWPQKISAGYAAAHKGYKAVVNDIEVRGMPPESPALPPTRDKRLEGADFDVVIIGGGIIGTLTARELTRYRLKIAVLEKEEDLATHASSRNDGMIHPGLSPSPKTKKANYNVRGNRAYTRLSRELGVPFRRPGSIILFHTSPLKALHPYLAARARQNGVEGYRYLSNKEVRRLEPNVTPAQHGGFFLPSTGVISPYKLVLAAAENALENGAAFYLNTLVSGLQTSAGRITSVQTNRGRLSARIIVNAAGAWADYVAGLAGDRFFSLHPRKGMDAILDMNTKDFQTRIIAMPPRFLSKEHTKGGGVIPTIEGNLLVGPTAQEVPGREDYATDPEHMRRLLYHFSLNTRLTPADIITYFAGTRACTYEEDFIIEASETVDNLIHAAGIQSPGLASAPAIAEDIAKLCLAALQTQQPVRRNPSFDPVRRGRPDFASLSLEERAAMVKKNPAFGRIVCRCEVVSEAEVREALHSPLSARSLDGVKRRTRAGTGRCQGGFCTSRIMQIMAKELGTDLKKITKKGDGSTILLSHSKEAVDYSGKRIRTIDT